MSLFRKPKKNVRNRGPLEAKESDEEQDNHIEEIQANISKLKEKKKEKKNKNKDKTTEEKKSSLLSFGDENEGEEDQVDFKIKKSSASRRLIRQKEKDKKENNIIVKDAKTEADDLDAIELPKNGKTDRNQLNNDVTIVENDVEIVLKDNVPKKPVDTWTISGVEAEALHMEEEDAANNSEGGQDASDEDDDDPLQKIIQSGGIPDAAAIHAARKKREAARARGGQDDFIPIKKKIEGENKTRSGTRLVREEDEDDGDYEERVSFTKTELKKDEEYHGKVRRDEASDDSDPEWEKMQISKAITGQQMAVNIDNQLSLDPMMPRAPPPPLFQGGGSSSDSGLSRPVKYDLPGIRDRMRKRLEEMREVSGRHTGDADRAVDDLVESQMEVDRVEGELPKLAKKHKFYQELRGYVTDLTDCYDEKVGMVTYLEGRLIKLYSETRAKLRERRRQDVRDAADTLAAMTATNMALGLDPVQDAVRDFRVAEREGRRIRRRKVRQERGELRHKEGMSSDEEMPGLDEANLAKVRQDVENQARTLLEDVVEEFSVLERVAARLSDWRQEDPDSYKSAYVSLCLPRIFGPLVRLQQLFWSPFTHKAPVSEQEWYRSLASFAVIESETFSNFETDPDRNLLSSCCDKILLPKLVQLTRAAYDPVSSSQTTRLVTCVNRLVADFPTITVKSKHLRELLEVVVECVKDCLDNDVYIPMYNKHQTESPNSPHSLFFQRQFWTSLKLMKNVVAWQGILSDPVLSSLVLDRLLNRYLLLSLRADPNPLDAVDKARQIVSLLPSWWMVPATSELAKLAMFSKFVVGLGGSKGLPREGVLECARVMAALGDHDSSEKLRELLVS